MNIFPEFCGELFCSGRGCAGAWQTPSPQRLWPVGMAQGPLPASLTAAAGQGALLAHRLCRCQGRGAERRELTAPVRHDCHPLPSLPLPSVGRGCLAFHAPRAAPGGRGGKEQVDFVWHSHSNQPSLNLAFPFPAPLPCS